MEPERKIEKLLRAFANKRRSQAGEPMELHPAMRQQLQREVGRRGLSKAGGGLLSGLFTSLRTKVAFAICFVAVGIVLFFALKPFFGRNPNSLAMNPVAGQVNTASGSRRAEPSLAPASPAPSSTVADNFDSGANRDRLLNGSVKGAPASKDDEKQKTIATAPEPSTPEGQLAKNNAAQSQIEVSPAPAVESPAMVARFGNNSLGVGKNSNAMDKIAETSTPPAAAPPAAVFGSTIAASEFKSQNQPATNAAEFALEDNSASQAVTKEETRSASPVAHQFYRVTSQNMLRTDAAADIPLSVLNSFRVEQNGLNIKVIDSDGSIYAGTLQPVSNQKKAMSSATPAFQAPAASSRAAKTSALPQMITNYFFRVSGTNHSLNQNIVFSGNLVPLVTTTHAAVNTPSAIAGFGGSAAGQAKSPSILSVSNAQILGRVIIGNRSETELNALPGPR